MDLEKLTFVPNAFYDFIVFIGSTVVFIVGLSFGIGIDRVWLTHLDFKAIDVVLLGATLVLAAYEYGRLAEAWSYVLVQKPLKFLSQHTRLLRSSDFLAKLPLHKLQLDPPSHLGDKSGNKWTVYYYASLVNPGIGSDLLKRYAWEKLARNSAFTYAVLWVTSVLVGTLRAYFGSMSPDRWSFGTVEYNITATVLMFAAYYEYYRRNCWNNDLLIKVLPVLMRAEELIREEKQIKVLPNAGSTLIVELRPGDGNIEV